MNNMKNVFIKYPLLRKIFFLLFTVLIIISIGCSGSGSGSGLGSYTTESIDFHGIAPDHDIQYYRVIDLIPYIEQGIIQGVTCQTCHGGHHIEWIGLTKEDHGRFFLEEPEKCQICHGEDLSNGAPQVDWISCNRCHHGTAGMAEGHAGKPCETCHDFSGPGTGVQGSECVECHGNSGSHAVHIGANSKGPNPAIMCTVCHDTDNFPRFGDEGAQETLAETGVCDPCHSPGGTYNGVSDPVIGAKANWADRVYDGDLLKPGKEKWCAGCHDEVPSVIGGVSAPNVIGNESAATDYGTGYGFYKTGHGLPAAMNYPASMEKGAGKGCLDCHSTTKTHIDGNPRSYTPDSDYLTYDPASASYQNGYRLKNVPSGYGGIYPLHIPRTGHVYPPGFREDWEFALCFECHDRDKILNGLTTAFRNDTTNFHDLHTDGRNGPWGAEGMQWDSDSDGTADSRMSCPACHNVHGSPSPRMVRHGELISTPGTTDKVPSFNFKYLPLDTYPALVNSTGGKLDSSIYGQGQVSSNGVCNMCHSNFVEYTRTIPDLTVIEGAYGAVGSGTVVVRFSRGVYGDAGGISALGPANFSLTDTDNGRTITGVLHNAGDDTATIILSSPLDGSGDLGTDTLSPDVVYGIYDYYGASVTVSDTIITGDSAPPELSGQSPVSGSINVPPVSDITFTITDSGAGINWETFGITLTGNSGYSASYTYADTGNVSKTGTSGSFNVTVNPGTDFGDGEVITAAISVIDLMGNSLIMPAWSFTAESSGSSVSTIVLLPEGQIDTQPENILSFSSCCGPYGDSHYIEIGDPAGLAGAAINSVTITLNVEFNEGPWPNPLPSAGKVQIGYRTGPASATVWGAVEDINDIGSVTIGPFTSDSDSNSLDLSDINNLETAFIRNPGVPMGGSLQVIVSNIQVTVEYIAP